MEENRTHTSPRTPRKLVKVLVFLGGAICLWPLCFVLGRALIPPDAMALRLSATAYVAAVVILGVFIASRESTA